MADCQPGPHLGDNFLGTAWPKTILKHILGTRFGGHHFGYQASGPTLGAPLADPFGGPPLGKPLRGPLGRPRIRSEVVDPLAKPTLGAPLGDTLGTHMWELSWRTPMGDLLFKTHWKCHFGDVIVGPRLGTNAGGATLVIFPGIILCDPYVEPHLWANLGQ